MLESILGRWDRGDALKIFRKSSLSFKKIQKTITLKPTHEEVKKKRDTEGTLENRIFVPSYPWIYWDKQSIYSYETSK